MFVPCILSAITVMTWFKLMRTLFGCLQKKKTSGQPPKILTARQRWMMANFQFLSAHLCIHTEHIQLGRLPTQAVLPVPEGDVEGGDDDDDAASVTSSQAPSQLPTSSQATPSQSPHDRRAPWAASGGKLVDNAILKLVDRLTQNIGMQDQLTSAVQEAA